MHLAFAADAGGMAVSMKSSDQMTRYERSISLDSMLGLYAVSLMGLNGHCLRISPSDVRVFAARHCVT